MHLQLAIVQAGCLFVCFAVSDDDAAAALQSGRLPAEGLPPLVSTGQSLLTRGTAAGQSECTETETAKMLVALNWFTEDPMYCPGNTTRPLITLLMSREL